MSKNIYAVVRYIKMPISFRAFFKEDEDGIYNIYIREDLPDWRKEQALKHEVEHIAKGDVEREDVPVDILEAANEAAADLSDVIFLGRGGTPNPSEEAKRKLSAFMNDIANGAKFVEIEKDTGYWKILDF